MKLAVIFLPSLVAAYLLVALPLYQHCAGHFSWFPVPICSVNFGDALKAEGISPIITSTDAEINCDDIKKGWCITDEHRATKTIVTVGDTRFEYATVTLKGVDIMSYLLR